MAKKSQYVYQGDLFHEYMELGVLKSDISTQYSYADTESETIESLYINLLANSGIEKKKIDRVFFENILFSHLKHVYINKFINKNAKIQNEEEFKKRAKEIIESLNHKPTIPPQFYDDMSEEGFYLMDRLQITKKGTVFLGGYDFQSNKGKVENARFMLVQVVSRGNNKPAYFIAGIEVDFVNRVCLVMIKNLTGIQKAEIDDEDEEVWDNTVNKLYNRVRMTILSRLGITTVINVEEDRQGMFELCKELDDKMLSEVRQYVKGKTESLIQKSVNEHFDILFTDKKPSQKDKENYRDKIGSLLLATYINTNIKRNELINKARELKLVGYTTRIAFTSNRASKGSAGTSGGAVPVASSEMFHSLYTDFKEALVLPKWSMSWFSDFKNTQPKKKGYIQTNIYSTKRSFRIVILAKRPLKKEFIHHVVGHLNKYRRY